jgi:hypothetical protein
MKVHSHPWLVEVVAAALLGCFTFAMQYWYLAHDAYWSVGQAIAWTIGIFAIMRLRRRYLERLERSISSNDPDEFRSGARQVIGLAVLDITQHVAVLGLRVRPALS